MDYSFGNSSSSSMMMDQQPSASGANVSLAAEKEQIMERVRSELAANNAQELISKLNEKCFAKCIGKPGSRLDGSEQVRACARSKPPYIIPHPSSHPHSFLISPHSHRAPAFAHIPHPTPASLDR